MQALAQPGGANSWRPEYCVESILNSAINNMYASHIVSCLPMPLLTRPLHLGSSPAAPAYGSPSK